MKRDTGRCETGSFISRTTCDRVPSGEGVRYVCFCEAETGAAHPIAQQGGVPRHSLGIDLGFF